MRLRIATVGLAILVSLAFCTTLALADSGCQFVLGFKTLHDLIPGTVGGCKTNVGYNPANGDGLQYTEGGMLVWRKADNWTAFTNGYQTWINGPQGLQTRLNTERFAWEPDSGCNDIAGYVDFAVAQLTNYQNAAYLASDAFSLASPYWYTGAPAEINKVILNAFDKSEAQMDAVVQAFQNHACVPPIFAQAHQLIIQSIQTTIKGLQAGRQGFLNHDANLGRQAVDLLKTATAQINAATLSIKAAR